ncbi:MAG: hypothetical protein RLZZ428_147 [Pseudomonadota bacterium]
MTKIKNLIHYIALFLPIFLFASNDPSTPSPHDDALAVFYTVDGDIHETYHTFIEKDLKLINFNLAGPHKRVNDQYKIKFGATKIDVLSFMPVINDKMILPLLNIDPRIAGFAPFNMLIYKMLDENVTHVGHLMPKVMLDILGIDDKEIRKKFTDSFTPLNAAVEKKFKGTKSYLPYDKLPNQTMINFEYDFDAPKDLDEFIETLQNKIELAFINKGYLIAGYHDFMENEEAEKVLSDYDAFWTYSLCHLKFSWHMFDMEGSRPEAGLFAPCTMYMYIRKGTNKLVVGMFRLHNWSDTLHIKTPDRLALITQLDQEIPEILTQFGMTAVPNINPLLRKDEHVAQHHSTSPTEQKEHIMMTPKEVPVPKNALAVTYTLEGNVEKAYNKIIEDELKSIDYKVTDPHHRINDQYEEKFGNTVLDTLSFLSVVNDKAILPLLNIDPRVAATAPFNMLIYKTLSENTTHVGHIVPQALLDMIGIKDEKVRNSFIRSIEPLDTKVEDEFRKQGLKYTKSYRTYNKLPKVSMLNFEYEFEKPDNLEDFIDTFQEDIELAFINKKYLIAGFHNFLDSTNTAPTILANYDAFWTYSLCHLEFSYNMFDTENAHPEAGLFAPCTMYAYIKKGSNKIILGMLKLDNWTTTLNITDERRVNLAQKLDTEIPEILTAFGMQQTTNTNPLLEEPILMCKTATNTDTIEKTSLKVANQDKQENMQLFETIDGKIEICIPKVPKVPVAFESKENQEILDRSIKFSKRVPPNYIPHRFDHQRKVKENTYTRIGEVTEGRISAYLRGAFMDVHTVEEKLKAAGFTLIASVPLDKKKTLFSIIFTDDSLLKMSNKPNKGFIASLRALVDTQEKTFSIMNPLYVGKGFLQNDFDEKAAHKVLAKIITQFPDLKNSKDALKYQLLPKYQFMNGMPYYHDMVEIASGDNLLEKIKNNNNVLFTQTLPNGATLIGVALAKKTNTFTKRIGRKNAAMLPYPILIENGKAKIMDPKYYLAYMYPLLQMSEFMTIATIPDAMIKDCEKVFK